MVDATTEQSKKRRRGNAILWSLLFLASLSSVDQAALALARQTWRRLAPEAGRDLIDARPVSNATPVPPASRYRFDADLVRYVAPNGKMIKPSAVKQQVATFVERAADEARTLTRLMTRGTIAVGEWQTQAATFVKSVHLATYIVGRGGMTAVAGDVPIMEDIVRYQLGKLQAFAVQVSPVDPIVESKITITDAAAESRLLLYIAGANGTYESGHGDAWGELAAQGVTVEARNVLYENAEHCGPSDDHPGCVDETDRGWVPRDEMSRPGGRTCRSNCLCRLDYRRAR